MSLRSQQRKAMVLSVLMVMLAQSAYSQYYQGWYPPVLEDDTEKKFVNPATCPSETRASGTAINVDGVLGNDSYAGTSDCPMKSLSAAVNAAVDNDEIIMHSGLYHDNVSIDGIDNLVIRAATGATVIFDGTKSITDDLGGVWSTADANGIQEVTLSQDGWQLFLAHEEQVPARWPNAQFSDETVFNRSYMAEGTLTNSNNAYTIGWLTDAGPEVGVHTGLNETINATGLDPVGAIAVMNLGSFRSNSREITGWNSANGTFSYDGTGVGWKSKHHAYFLEGKRELIDADGEWWYNNSDNRLHYKTPSSQDANDLGLRVKVQPFAISVDNSDGVTIQGIDFFGTTVNFNNCDECSFTNSTMQYPSTSKRGLGIAGESEDDRWMTRFYRCTNTFVDNISITNTDGGAIEFHGSGGQSHNNTVNNSYFHAIDWSAADQKGLMTTIYEGGRDMYFTNNSVHLTGASSVLSIGDAPKVFYNRVWDVGHLQTDGAVVQVMQGEAPGAEIAYNWIHDVIKYGARFDAPIGQAGEGRNGTMHHNVIWNAAGGLMVKGDYHDIHNNTVFNSSGKNDIIFLTDGGINNKNSTLHNNAVDAMADHRSGDVFANPLPNGSHWNNWNGYLQGYDGMFEARNQISCAIYDNGSLYCWGRNDHGQLGLGSTSGREDAPQFVDFGTGRTVNSLGMGSSGAEGWEPNSHTCAVLDNGSLMCWGANGDGQLGIGNVSANGVWEPTFVNVGSGLTVISVATASSSSCALLSNQSVKCWGRNNFGQLGLGNISNNDVLTPHYVNFIGSSKPVSLHAGMNSYCAQLDNGSIACWGRNIDGELGLGNTTNQNTPVTLSIPAGRAVSTVSLGKRFMCLSYDNGSVACVGVNDENQLGQGGVGVSQSSLSYVNGIEMMVQRVDSAQEVACAHLVNGSVVCWGEDKWGLFGNSSSSYTNRTASTATEYVNFGLDGIAASISVSMRHSCAVLDNGDLTCWGRNHKSQLGLGNMTQQFMPVVVSNVSTIRQVQIHEMLVDPANEDFRPKWGSHLQQLSAGAYDAGDSNPWTAGISWTYSSPSAPVAGCMLDYADNYDSDAIVSDGSCTFSSYTPSSSLDLRLHVDPANSGSYSGSGTDLVDLSTYSNDGTIDGAAWEANRTRFYYDGSCSGATAPANQAGTYVCDEVTFAETNDHDPDANGDWSVSVWMNATTVQHSVIIGKWNGGGSASDLGYIIRIGSDNKLYTSVGTTSGSSAVSTSRISIDEDRWYHLVMVADAGNILRLYADGVNVVNASLSGSGSIRNTTSGISIGSYNAGEYNQPFDGNIGEVMIFADALNSTTINQMYNASKGAYSNTTSLSYSDSSYTFVKGQPYNLPLGVSNGDVTTSYTLAGSLPSGMNFGSSNGTIWGTPTADMSSATYTVTANNSAGSFSTTITLTVNDVPPSITYSASSLSLLKGAQMSALAVTNSGGAIVSCSVSPSLPNGMSLSSTCELSGTPTVASTNASYTITATNTAGSDSTSIYIEVLNSGGTLTVTPTHSTGSVNATLASIAASYSHSLTIPSWTSSVTNTSVKINNSGSVAGTAIAAWDNGDLVIAWTRPIYGGTTQHVLAISVYDGNSWTTQDIDTASRTGYRPSIAIDSQGALHIAYLDRDNTNLRYATNASGSWVLSTLDNSSVNPNNVAAKTGIAIDNRGHVHIIHPVQGSGVWVLNYTTNVSGSFVSTTITDTTKDDGKYASLAIAGNGSLHISVYRDNGGSDLRYYTDESGVWTNETVRTGSNFGKDSAIALNSKDEVVIVYRRDDGSDDIYMSVGNRGSWTSSQVASNRNAMYLAVAIDSNDDVHISSHNSGGSSKDLEYFTNSSGSWVRTTLDAGVGGIFGSIVIDSNDDVHIAHADTIGANDLQYATAKGSGKGLAVNPVFSVSPSLPDGLILNWKTGEITGTPTVASTNTTYTLTALALGATTTATFTLHVTGAPGDISYNDISGTNGVAITPALPTITTNGTTGGVTTWAINASLPTGLTFESSNGTIWGTPTQIIAGAVFTIWANNSVGSKSTTINITINDVSVSSFTYASENITLSYYHTMTTTTPTTTGGSATSWAISPSLPSGLTFNTATGAISGTPETLQTTTVTYTIWANNSGGSFSDQINITINDHSPAPINYFGANITLDYNQTITPIGDFEVKPDLIAGGEDHTCAIQSDGSVRCWGEGSFGRLGHGGGGDKSTPTATASLGAGRTAIDITAGSTHTCAVLDNGSVSCWGLNDFGQLGDGTTTNRFTPTQTLSLGRPAIAVEAGSHFSTCALLDNGSVSCWGRNHKGQLGRGFTNSTADLSQRTPALTVPMPGGLPVVALDISHYMVCGVLSDGSIACWGQYGGGNTPSLQTFFNSSNPAIDVSTGRYAGCGLLENGSVTCWGTAWLGTGGESQSANAGVIWPNLGSGRTAVQIEMGRKHRCVLLDDDTVKCWGNDSYGQLGNGAGQGSKNAPYSTSFSSNLGLQSMSSGHWHTCIASKTNEIYCWGDGASGKQGDGSTNNNQVPGKTSYFSGTNPVKAHGEITSWEIHPALPTGLSFGSTNGTLYGTPTASLAQTNFTVYANNSGGSSTFILNLGVGPAPPGPFVYNPENNSITNNSLTQIAPSFVNGTNTGGAVTSWAINNTSLPTGLTFSTSNGTIYGTPTQLWNRTAYKVWANNSGGSVVAYFNLTVNDQIPTLSYSPDDLTLTKNQTSSDLPLNATLTGSGAITSWAISPALPSGLTFGTSNGTIWGTPTSLMTLKTFTIWANNSGGSVNATVNITVNDEAPDISYNPDWFVLTNNTAMSPPATPTNSGGAVPSTVIDSTGQVGYYTSIAIDSNGYKHISYYDSTNGDLKYSTDKTGSWVDISVDTTGIVGIWTSIAIDSNDAVHISYYDTTNGGLKYATCSSGCTTASNWDDVTVDTAGDVGSYSSIAIDSNDAVHISYFDKIVNSALQPVGDLKYATCSSTCTTASNWDKVSVDTTGDVGRHSSIAIDSNDAVHISYLDYTNRDLKYATCSSGCTTASNWDDVSVDTTGIVGHWISIAIDSNDAVHISYYDTTNVDLKYATCSSGCTSASNWDDVSVDTTGMVGAQTSIAIDSNDAVHISYFDITNVDLKYATCSSGCTTASNWDNVSVDTTGDVGRYSSIAIDSNDAVHISYLDYTNRDLKYIVLDSSSNIYGYSVSPDLPAGLSLNAFTGEISGTPTELSTNTTYTITVRNSGGVNTTTITIEVLDQLPGLSYSPENLTLTINNQSSDLPLNATVTGSGAITSWAISPALPSGLSFGTSNGTIWGTPTSLMTLKTFTIWANNSGGSVNATVNITVNDELPNISYSPDWFVLTNNTAMSPTATPTNSGGAVPSTVIDSIGDIGEFSSIAIDSYGFKHISYFDATNIDIKYATDKTGSWVTISIDTSGNVGSSTSIAIDSNDAVHISYYDATNTGLKYATCSSGCTTTSNWNIVSVDTTGNVGWWTSIAINSNNAVHISYYDSTNDDLKYATCASSCSSTSSWSKVTVDSSGDVGKYSSVAIDSNDAVHISYRDSTNDDLKYATCSSSCSSASSWTTSTIDSVGNVGSRTSIAIDSNDALHISYHDITNGDLKYATDQSGSWANTTVDSVGTVGQYTSIAIDSNDVVHISYYDATNKDLKYATNMQSSIVSGVGGVIKFIDRDAEVGRYSSIAVDSSGDVHISYYGATNGDLKYATLEGVHPWNVYAYSISPSLPAGLEINMNTGEISGTPTELSTNTTYTITVWNTGGSNTTTITIEVIDQLPSISYSPDNLNLTNNTVSSDLPLAPTITGPGDITSWEINATLPSGINFGSDNGTLWGIPTELWPQASYMVWANNSGGTAIAYLNITVIDQLSTISYSPADLILTNNTNSTDLPLAPTITGPGEIVTWEMNGTLPSGISFGNNNGTIWGVPTELWNQTQYMVWANNTGGSAVAYLNITVVDQLPTLSYVPENLTLLNNTQSPSLPLGPTLSGAGIILEWGISDGLPSGLSFGNDNGTIWGIPTERMSRTTFTIWANNSGGSVNASINITVLHQQPLFNYSVLDLMLVNNTVMNNVTSTVTGGEIVSWEVSPDMPDGIAIGANGNISGLPIVVQNRTMYMIWANNTGGSHVVYLNITIYDIIATLDYIPENLTLTRNESMTDLSPTYSGIVDSWEIHPALPDGLNFTNGTISGTPENNMTRSTYTVYANNTGGSISHTINITVLEPVMEFEYIPANVTLVNNTASTDMPMVPILYNDGVAETWEIWPALPSGLNFSSTNGTISGIATELQVIPVNYTIWANNSGGIASTVISITIVDQLPNLTYPGDLELMNNTNSSDLPMLPILDGAGVIVTWEINATLPAGLNFSSENGSIYGIATELWTKTQYTVWANNSGGSSMAMFNVTVVDQVPTDIGYNHEWLVLTRNENNSGILPLTPNLVGPGAITSWEINGTLPTGLNFSSENGTIWGIPTELYHNWQNITIYANNTGGSVVSIIAIMVNDQIPTISYNLSQVVLKNDTEMDSIEAIHGGGPFITLAIHPQLPAGMYFGYDNATIWGQPTELTSKIEYTIWANNSGGSASTTINITIEDNAPVFDYISTEFTFYVDTEMAELPLTVASSGGEIQNFSITPQLPAGLSFGESNGTIWGVATQDIGKTTFTISAYNPLGVYSVDIDIAVYDYVYGFELDPIWVANDSFMQPIKPTYIIPGATYSVDPDLPEGMSVNPNTGVVSGRPNSTMQLTSYTLIASVDGYTLSVPMKLGMLEDTDLDGMPDEIPPGGNALRITEDLDDDNDKVDDLTEIDCDTDPLDAEDKPKFNSNGNCAPEPAGIGFLWCLPMILLLLLLMVLIIAIKKKDDPGVVSANNTKPSEKKKGREKWMQDYRIDDDEVEWGEDKEGSWWRRTKSESEWSEWDKAP